MKAAKQFVDELRAGGKIVTSPGSRSMSTAHSPGPAKVTTDTAIIMGLAGNLPENVDIDGIPEFISASSRPVVHRPALPYRQLPARRHGVP